MKNNEKGSILLVTVLVILLVSVVTILTVLFVSQKISYERSSIKVFNSVYEKDKLYALSTNITKQYLNQIKYENIQDILWDIENSKELEKVIEKTLLPKFIGDYEVKIDTTNDIYVKSYCDELISNINNEEELLGFECRDEPINLGFNIKIYRENKIYEFNFLVDNLRLKVDDDGQTLKLDLYNVKTRAIHLEG